MHARERSLTCSIHRAALAMFTACTLAAPTTARAEFGDEGFELEDLSARTLRHGELSVGTRGVAIGLFDVTQLGTNFVLDALGAPNASIEATIVDLDRFAVGLELGLLQFYRETDRFSICAVPISIRASGNILEELKVHGSVDVLATWIDNDATDVIIRLARLFFRAPEVSFSLGAEYRFNRHVAIMTELQIPLDRAPALIRYEDEEDTLDFFRATAGVHLVFGTFNLRVGAGYGPSFLGRAGFFPMLDLGVRIP